MVAILWAAIGASVGCGPKAVSSPSWILGSPARYPSSLFIIGVGSAPTSGDLAEALKAASASARAEIAQTLEVQIEHAEEYVVDTVSERGFSDRPSTGSAAGSTDWAMEVERSSLTTYSRTSTSQIIEGIQLKEKFRDENSGTLYVLAVLDKTEAEMRLQRQLAKLRQAINESERLGAIHRETGDPLAAMSAYRQALNRSLRADILRRQLGVIEPRTLWEPAPNDSGRLAALLAALLHEFHFYVDVDRAEIEDSIHEVLAATEFNVGKARAPVGLTLWGRLNTKWDTYPTPPGGGDDLQVCRMYLGFIRQ